MYFDSVIDLGCQYDLLVLANNTFTVGSFCLFHCFPLFFPVFFFFTPVA